jgi:hypothetical protein
VFRNQISGFDPKNKRHEHDHGPRSAGRDVCLVH